MSTATCNTPPEVRDWLQKRGHQAPAIREPLGARLAGDTSVEIMVEPAAGSRLLHFGNDVRSYAADAEQLAEVILARVVASPSHGLVTLFAREVSPLKGQWRVTADQLRAWVRDRTSRSLR